MRQFFERIDQLKTDNYFTTSIEIDTSASGPRKSEQITAISADMVISKTIVAGI